MSVSMSRSRVSPLSGNFNQSRPTITPNQQRQSFSDPRFDPLQQVKAPTTSLPATTDVGIGGGSAFERAFNAKNRSMQDRTNIAQQAQNTNQLGTLQRGKNMRDGMYLREQGMHDQFNQGQQQMDLDQMGTMQQGRNDRNRNFMMRQQQNNIQRQQRQGMQSLPYSDYGQQPIGQQATFFPGSLGG